MGKFDGILIGTDLDGTLLADDKSIPSINKEKIEYFMSEGGFFTFITGRTKKGIAPILSELMPNTPIVIMNGAAIYDPNKNKIIWETFLDDKVEEVLEMIEKNFPSSGIEVCKTNNTFISRGSARLEEQLDFEKIPKTYIHFSELEKPWNKALFIQEADETENVRKTIANSEYSENYNFVQSSPWYYEILPKDASKGNGLLKLADILGISHAKTIGVGDHENDYSLVKNAGIGVAVADAIPELLEIADFKTLDNNSGAISYIIENIENKNITL